MSSMEVVKNHKIMIRKNIHKILKNMTKEEITTASTMIAQNLIQLPAFVQAKTVCAYLAMPQEASTDQLLHEIFKQGKKLYVPKVTGARSEDMQMLRVDSFEDIASFPKSKWNIPEPGLEKQDGTVRLDALDALDLDLIIVPGVAFDAECNRLGHGKGYYDCFFERYASKITGNQLPPTIGIALSQQIIDHVPTSPHDRILSMVVIPDRVISPNE